MHVILSLFIRYLVQEKIAPFIYILAMFNPSKLSDPISHLGRLTLSYNHCHCEKLHTSQLGGFLSIGYGAMPSVHAIRKIKNMIKNVLKYGIQPKYHLYFVILTQIRSDKARSGQIRC